MAGELLDRVGLPMGDADRTCGSYSGGNRRKLAVAVALVGVQGQVPVNTPLGTCYYEQNQQSYFTPHTLLLLNPKLRRLANLALFFLMSPPREWTLGRGGSYGASFGRR